MPKISKVLVLICCFFSLLSTANSYAQSPIVVTQNDAVVSFPDTITFHTKIQSASDIADATLIYGTNGRSCQTGGSRQPIEFESETAVSLEWEWELKRSGALPPGVNIWWQWEIEDADGNRHTTGRQEIIVQDERFNWQTLSENGVTVNWIQGGTAFGQSMLNEADLALDRLAIEMGVPRPETIALWVYPTAEDVQEALIYASEWAGGVAFPDYGITIIGVAPGEEAWAARVIPHELSHLVVGIRTFNCRGVRLPTWLNEGLARYSENNIAQIEIRQVEAALADGNLPPLRSLASGFSAYGGSASLSYTQSYQVVEHLIEEYGPDQMTELLATMQSGIRIDEALEQVYGFDTNELDARWRAGAGFAATPTSEADALAAQATPTLVPTLALISPLSGQATVTPMPASPTSAPPTTTAVPATPVPPTNTAVPTETAFLVPTIVPVTPTETPDDASSALANSNWLWIGGAAFLVIVLVAIVFSRIQGS